MDNLLTFEKQIVLLKKKSFNMLRKISKIRCLLSEDDLKIVVNSLVVSCLDYCNAIYYGINGNLIHQLQLILNAAAKIVKGKFKYDHIGTDLCDLHWLPIRKRIIFKIALLSYKSVNGIAPMYLQDFFHYRQHGHRSKFRIPNTNLKYGKRSFSVVGPQIMNNLPLHITQSENVLQFKKQLKTYLFSINCSELNKLTDNTF